MGRDFHEGSPEARAVLDEAAAESPADFLDILFEGPAEKLNHTATAQPALLAVEIAIARHLEARGITPSGCAGHSLGEFSALVCAQVLSFKDAFALVQLRGKLMAEEAPEGGMAAVIGLAPEAIEKALPTGVEVANYNGPQQTIISGTISGIEKAETSLKEAGAKRILRLPVSGAFHSFLMRAACDKFAAALDDVHFNAPRCPFVSSVSGKDIADGEQIRRTLKQQIVSPVRWTGVMQHLGVIHAIEVGPGKVLQGLAKRTDAAPEIEVAGTLEAANQLEKRP